MLDNVTTFFKKMGKKEQTDKSKNAAKERLHLVLMQDRANVSADFLEMMKQEIVDVIKKYIDVDETDMDVKLENRVNNDGTSGAPALYANIPIVGINEEKKKESEGYTKAKQSEEENIVSEKREKTKATASNKKISGKTVKTAKTSKSNKNTDSIKKTSAKNSNKKEKTEGIDT